jgi:hypothetical protein
MAVCNALHGRRYHRETTEVLLKWSRSTRSTPLEVEVDVTADWEKQVADLTGWGALELSCRM